VKKVGSTLRTESNGTWYLEICDFFHLREGFISFQRTGSLFFQVTLK